MAQIVKGSEQIHLFTTPEELRKLADKMEKRLTVVKMGESLIIETWIGDKVDLIITYAQGK